MEKIEIIKSVIYIILLLYCSVEVSTNFKELSSIIEKGTIEESLIDINNFNNIEYSQHINNNVISFTYYEFSLYTYKLIETFLYFNIMFMLLIFLSQKSEGVLNLIKNDE